MLRAIRVAWLGCVAVCGLAAPAFAQDRAPGDISICYSILNTSAFNETLPGGFVLAAAGHVNSRMMIGGEFGGNYKTTHPSGVTRQDQVLGYVAGVRVIPVPKAKTTPFVQVQAGLVRWTTRFPGVGSGSTNGFAIQPGFGVDFPVSQNFNGRIQVDYRSVRNSGTWINEYRLAFGVSMPLGR